jgi:hypothetical protein
MAAPIQFVAGTALKIVIIVSFTMVIFVEFWVLSTILIVHAQIKTLLFSF